MSRMRLLGLLMLASTLGSAAGCFGLSQNPSYFPYWLPTGDVVPTHAKPIGPGYYADFDPHAVELVVAPTVTTAQVGSQVVLLATVRDEKASPVRDRRVDWLVTGGTLVEVDESGIFNGRGACDGKRGVSFTGYCEHRLTRGNADKPDDVMLRPGQSWCVVTSPEEGDTHVQVIVPGIANWDKRMKTAVIRWVNVAWEFPPPVLVGSSDKPELITKITSVTDRKPLANYRVRYKIIDGPPAMLLPSQTQEQVAISDLNGLAKVRVARLTAGAGTNRVSIEIIRPPDPTTPSGSGVSIVTGETSVGWLAPAGELGSPIHVPDAPAAPPTLGPPMGPVMPPATLGPPGAAPEIKLGTPTPLDGPAPR